MTEGVGECTPVGRRVVDSAVSGLVGVELDPVRRRVVDRFIQLDRCLSLPHPNQPGFTSRRPPRHRNVPQLTSTPSQPTSN